VRCFTFNGKGEVVESEIDIPGNVGTTTKVMTKYWRLVKDWWDDGASHTVSYLSVNALTLDAAQENLDVAEWTQKMVAYVENLELEGSPRGSITHDKPYPGGCY
jgi:hypothetical protein